MQPVAPVTSTGDAVLTSLAGALALLFAAIPRVIGFIIVLIIGWIIAAAIATAVAAVLRSVKFNQMADRAGISGFVRNMGVQTDPAGFIANIVRWFIRLIVLVVAFDELGLPAVSQVMQSFLLWLPNLVVAIVVLVIAGILANAAADLVRGATAESGLGNPDMLAGIAKVAVWAFGIIVAVNQIGIATTLINTLFMGFVAAVALAAGLAFGLGGRDTAAQIVSGWYQKGQNMGPKLAQAGEAAQRQGQLKASSTPTTVSSTTVERRPLA